MSRYRIVAPLPTRVSARSRVFTVEVKPVLNGHGGEHAARLMVHQDGGLGDGYLCLECETRVRLEAAIRGLGFVLSKGTVPYSVVELMVKDGRAERVG